MVDCVVCMRMGKKLKSEISSLNDQVLGKLFDNFIKPLRLNYRVSELEGKYKPSWAIPLTNTCALRQGLADFAKEHSLYHYHFGYPYYNLGRDSDYPGKESDGIVHTAFISNTDESSLSET